MNDVTELKRYALVHARAQGMSNSLVRRVLGRITTDDGGPGSWTSEWSRAAGDLGSPLDAARVYNMARFPFAGDPARAQAQASCVAALDDWRADHPDIQRLDVVLDGHRIRCWAAGLSTEEPRPVLLVSGGIVTVKEQWLPVLASVGKLGMAGVVMEMPGVGENTLPYDANSWRMLPAVLDAIGRKADVDNTYAMTLSFSGHLALRAAVADRRIRGIVTAGAPVAEFFTDRGWQARLPRITVDTLAHLLGCAAAEVPERIGDRGLRTDQLTALDIPMHYLASDRDEIIPPGEVTLLRQHVRGLRLVRNDDVHGSPRHTAETRLWSVLSVLRMRGIRDLRTALLGSALRVRRLVGKSLVGDT
jgi:esterase FrsA